jgi:hypothetical protein
MSGASLKLSCEKIPEYYNDHYNTNRWGGYWMPAKTERITILGSPDFKAFLTREAKKEDEELLSLLVAEVNEATARAKASLEKGLQHAESVLAELRGAA